MLRLQTSRFLLAVAILLGLSPLQNLSVPNAVMAATAADLSDLQAEMDIAMDSRPATYSTTYSGTAPTAAQVSDLLDAIYDADDYLHYATKSYKFTILSSASTWTVNFTFTYWETTAETADVTTKVNDTLASILTGGMNDFQKQKAIHDWIVSNVEYDGTGTQHSAYAALFGAKKTVCQGYSLLAYRMLTQAGIENKIVEGAAGGQLHTWNLVKLDGNWYHYDATWNDPLPDVPGRINYDYYNLTDAQIKANHAWTRSYPAASTDFAAVLADKKVTDAVYAPFYSGLETSIGLPYLDNAKTVNTSGDLITAFQDAMAANATIVKVRHTKKSRVAIDLPIAASKFGNLTSYTYAISDFMLTTLTTDVVLTINLSYTAPVAVTGLTLTPLSDTVNVGANLTLTPAIAPANASLKLVNWSSSASGIATVSPNGVVSGVSPGTAVITAASVDGSLSATSDITVVQPVTAISLNVKSTTLKISDPDYTLIPTIAPANATDQSITWTSSSPSVATVVYGGIVHAVAPGKTTITVKTANNLSASAEITVPVAVDDMTLNKTAMTLDVKKTFRLIPTISPATAAVKTVTWSSDAPAVATVNSAGIVTGKAVGTANITATTSDGGITKTTAVTIVQPVTGLSLNVRSKILKMGDPDYTLLPTILPVNASDPSINWTSSKPTVATVVYGGVVHAVAPGITIIKVISANNLIAVATISVPVPVSGVTLNKSTLTLDVNKSFRLVPKIAPANAAVKSVTWTSSDPTVATVSTAGVISAKALGTANITAATADGNLTAVTAVTVVQPVTAFTLNTKKQTVRAGEADYTLTASITPGNATDKSVSWISSKPAVATVDSSGVVHAVTAGITVIAAKSSNGKTATAVITVAIPASGVTLNSSTFTINVNASYRLIPTLAPSNATIKTVTWSSSDANVAVVGISGVVTGKTAGTATITATTTDGSHTATAVVTVNQPVLGVSLDTRSLTMKVGDADVKLTATLNPSTSSDPTLTWTSSNYAVATVDSSGMVHVVGTGSAVIRATASNGKYAGATVFVKP